MISLADEIKLIVAEWLLRRVISALPAAHRAELETAAARYFERTEREARWGKFPA